LDWRNHCYTEGTVVYAAQDGVMSGFGVPLNGLEDHTYLITHEGGLNNFTPEGFQNRDW